MARALTARGVEAAKADPAKRQEIPDGALPGLFLVVQPSGAKSWAVRYRHENRPRKLTLGKAPALSLGKAREAARVALRAVAEGADPAGTKASTKRAQRENPDRDLVRGVVADFLTRHVATKRGHAEMRRILEREVLPAWGSRRLDSITRRDVIELLDGIADRGAPVMANRTLAQVRRLFSWAVARDVVPASPVAGVKPVAAETSRDRVLSDAEVRAFWQATGRMGPPFGPMLRTLLLTAQRLGEVAEMTASEIEGDVWVIPAARAKNGRAHAVPLSEAAHAALAAQPRIAGAAGYVFTTTGETPLSGFSRAKRRLDALMAEALSEEAGETVALAPWRLHDLRRTAATGMARCGTSRETVEKVLNHVSGAFGGVAGVYNRHGYEAEMRRALDAWAGLVERIATGQTAKVVALHG
ncbi:MAG: tyrosine-type recombinase/integrase [Paracoccaceae bacterium]